jgi:hypothetical protein
MNTIAIIRRTGLPLFAWLTTAAAIANDRQLTIRAGDHDRSESIVSFTAPDVR